MKKRKYDPKRDGSFAEWAGPEGLRKIGAVLEARARSARNRSAARAREHARVLRSAVAVLDAIALPLTYSTPELKRTRNFLARLATHLEGP